MEEGDKWRRWGWRRFSILQETINWLDLGRFGECEECSGKQQEKGKASKEEENKVSKV
jgi:hypothetical protein